MEGSVPGWLLRSTFAAGALIGASLVLTEPAEAASFRCSAFTSVNDAGPGSDTGSSTPCGVQYGNEASQAFAAVSSTAGVLRAGTSVNIGEFIFAGASAYTEFQDDVIVSGLGAEGATLNFLVSLDGFLNANASAAVPFVGAATASSSFESLISLSTSAGRGASKRLSGCTRSVDVGISVCNGDFDYGVSQSETIDALIPISIFVNNGDSLHITASLRTSSLGHTPLRGMGAGTTAGFGHTMYWDGLVFDDATRNVVLTSASTGFDYRNSAFPDVGGGVPEPATWALMIAGFGLAGGALRRRRVAVA
jgi:hypothetical protein